MRKLRYVLAATIVATLYASFAAAHAVLVSSSPSSGSVLTQAPREIRLSFNERIEARFSNVTLTRNDGRRVQAGRASADPQRPNDVVFSLPALQAGRYQVNWQATSADSHRIRGNFGFEVRQ